MTLIALEEAFSIPELDERYPGSRDTGGANIDKDIYRDIAARLKDFTELRLPDMDRHGVDMHVLGLTVPGLQMADLAPADAVDAARLANDYLADVVDGHPDRFAGYAALPLQDPEAAAVELRRAVGELGMCGAMVNDHADGNYLDDPMFDVLWDAFEELDLPLYLHPGAPRRDHWDVLQGCPQLLGALWSWAAEAGGHGLRLVFNGVFDRHPGARIILGHMGEWVPYMGSRLDSRYSIIDTPVPLAHPPSYYLGRNILATTSGVTSPGALAGAVLAFGADAILFAIDYPYEKTEPATHWFAAAPLSDADRHKIAHGNAERLLKLPVG